MASRSVWSGFVRFSLVAVPVKAYTAAATGGGDISLNQLHKACNSRIQYKKTCPIHGEVKAEEIVSGYEFDKGQLRGDRPGGGRQAARQPTRRSTSPRSSRPSQFDARYFNGKHYYLLPDGPVGQHRTRCWSRRCRRRGDMRFAQVVFPRQGAGRAAAADGGPAGDVDAVVRAGDEARRPSSRPSGEPKVELPAKEVAMAKSLIDTMSPAAASSTSPIPQHVHGQADATDRGEDGG